MVGQRFQRQVGVHRFRAITRQHGEVVYLARCAGLHNQTGCGAQAFTHQMLVNSAEAPATQEWRLAWH
jgi:hypothetical protein